MRGKILITGATGFIGANLAHKFVDSKCSIIIRKESNTWRIRDIIDRLDVNYADLIDYKSIRCIVNKVNPDYIFHLATYGSYPDRQKEENKIIKTNIIGTYNMLKALEDSNYKCFINMGSSSEYGIKDTAIKEDDPLKPVNIYGFSKASATILCQTFARMSKKKIVTVRPFSVYGPYEERFRLIPHVITHCLNNKDISITSGEQKRDFIYVDDVIDACIRITEKENISGEVFNIGTGIDHSIKNTAKMIIKLTKAPQHMLKIGNKKTREFETFKSWKSDTTKVRNLLDFEPKYPLEDGLKMTISWFRKNSQVYQNG